MSIQHMVERLEKRIRDTQGDETTVPKADLIQFIEAGEKQLEGLFEKIKESDRERTVLADRSNTQRATIGKLQSELSQLKSRKRKRS